MVARNSDISTATMLIAYLLFKRDENWENKEKVNESERRFRLFTEHASDIIFVYRLKPQYGFDYVSPSATRITGYTPEEHYADPNLGFKLVHPDDKPLLESFFAGKSFNKPITLRWKKKDGTVIWTEQHNVPIYDENGELTAIHGIVRDITQRKLAEQKLMEREQTLSNLIENLPGFIYRCANDPDWTMLYLSPTVKNITGYAPDDFIANHVIAFNDIILPKYRQYLWDKWQNVLANRQQFVDEYEIQTKDGQIRWVWEQGKGVFDANGNLLYLDGYITDITDRKKAEWEVDEKEHELREIFNSTQEAIILYDFNTRKIVDCNTATQKIYGYTKDELIGNPIGYLSSFNKPYTLEEAEEILKKVITQGPQTYIWQGKKKNGELLWVEISLKVATIRGDKRFIAVVRDITENKKNQIRLAQREREFREIFNSTSEAIIVYDTENGVIADCNDRAVEMYGYSSKKEFMQCRLTDLGANVEPYTNEKIGVNTLKAITEGPQRFDWLAKRKNGEHFWVEVSLKRTLIGGIERDLTVIRDITERKRYEEDLIKAKEKAEESDRLKSAFLANLSHEIRTPMNAIMGFTDLLRGPVKPEKINQYLEFIQKSGQRLLEIIDQTLEVAKLDSGLIKLNPEVFDLNQVMKDLYNELRVRASKNKELELMINNKNLDTPFNIYTDRVKLYQILTNLIVNGIKYTPRGAVMFGYEIEGNKIVLTVQDTGIGIDKKHRDLIFKRFYRVDNPLTLKTSGIGLGLAITKAYVELLGGNIEIQSELGKGTKVKVKIPYHKAEPSPELFHEPAIDNVRGNKEFILVAEDDEYNFLLVNEILKNSNYTCIRASNGKDAVDIVRTNDNIRLILMDLKMPIMDGYEAFSKIKKINPDIPIVAQTAYTLGEEKEKIIGYGFDGFLSKPIRKTDLLMVVSSKLKGLP